MDGVDITDGLTYGFKLMGYYIGVAVVGGVMTAVGVGMTLFEGLKVVLAIAVAFIPSSMAGSVPVGAAQSGPNIGFIIFALVIIIAGVLLVLAGLFGSLYKLIADAVAEGRRLSEVEEDSSREAEPSGEDTDSDGEDTDSDGEDTDSDGEDDAEDGEKDDTADHSEASTGDDGPADPETDAATAESSETAS
jgi:Sec-independent protein translocase protein TatA